MIRCNIVIVYNASLVGLRTGLHSLISRTAIDPKLIIKGCATIDRGLFCAEMPPHNYDILQYVAESSIDHTVNTEALNSLLSNCAPTTCDALDLDDRLPKQ